MSWGYQKIFLIKNYKTLELEKLKIEPIVAHLKEPNNGKYSLNFFAQNIPNFPKKDDLYIICKSGRHYISFIKGFKNSNPVVIPVEFFRSNPTSGLLNRNNYFDYFEHKVPFIVNNNSMPLYSSINLCNNDIYYKMEYFLIKGIKLSVKLLIEQKLLLDSDICYFSNLKSLFGDKYQNMSVEQFMAVINNLSEDEIYRFLKKENYTYKIEDTKNFLNYSKSLKDYLEHNKKLDDKFIKDFKYVLTENEYYNCGQDVRFYFSDLEKNNNVDNFIDKFLKMDQTLYIITKSSTDSNIVEMVSINKNCFMENNVELRKNLVNHNSIYQVGHYTYINNDLLLNLYNSSLDKVKYVKSLHSVQCNNILLNDIKYKNCIIQNLDNIDNFNYALKNIIEEILCDKNNFAKFDTMLFMAERINLSLNDVKNYIDIYNNILKNEDMCKFYIECLQTNLDLKKHDKDFLQKVISLFDSEKNIHSELDIMKFFEGSCNFLKFFIKNN